MAFTVTPTSLPGVMIIDVESHRDERGSFSRLFCRDELESAGLCGQLAQASLSRNPRAGTVRGMHYQCAPHGEHKLVACVRGAVFDAVIDARRGAPTFGAFVSAELTEENRRMLFIPPGFAHGFQTLADHSAVAYFISVPYAPASAAGIRWDDPVVGIPWPSTEKRIISARDRALPLLAESRAP